MGTRSRAWIEKSRKRLTRKYPGKTILVSDNKILRVFDGTPDPVEINLVAQEICGNKDWSYAILDDVGAYLL